MRRAEIMAMLAAVVALTTWTSHAGAQQQVGMTVQQLFRSSHQIELIEGTEVVWADPHFEDCSVPFGAAIDALSTAARGKPHAIAPGRAPTEAPLPSWPVMQRTMCTS